MNHSSTAKLVYVKHQEGRRLRVHINDLTGSDTFIPTFDTAGRLMRTVDVTRPDTHFMMREEALDCAIVLRTGYLPIEKASEDTTLAVQWGSMTKEPKFGMALKLGGSWFMHSAPNQPVVPCSTPDGFLPRLSTLLGEKIGLKMAA